MHTAIKLTHSKSGEPPDGCDFFLTSCYFPSSVFCLASFKPGIKKQEAREPSSCNETGKG